MRRIALAAVAAVLAAGCTAASSPAARPTPTGSPGPLLSTGRVRLALVAVCGAGSKRCPRELIQRFGQHARQHDGYFFATPDTAFVGGQGCGTDFPGPVGSATVSGTEIRWTVDWTQNGGQDCFGSVFAFVRFVRPVFDMHSPVAVITHDRAHHRVYRTRAWPAPDLAAWAHGRDMLVVRRQTG